MYASCILISLRSSLIFNMYWVSRFFRIAMLSVSVFFLSCDSDDEAVPPTVQLLKLTVAANYPTTYGDNWVLVHDANGKLLGAKKFEASDVVSLDTQDAVTQDLMSVTLVSLVDGAYVELFTYAHVAREQEWALARPGVSGSENNYGSVYVKIRDLVNMPFNIQVSAGQGQLLSAIYNEEQHTSNVHMDFDKKAGSILMAFMETELDHPQYQFIQNVQDGGHYEVSAVDFKDFDHTADVSFPAVGDITARLSGYDTDVAGTSYTLYESSTYAPRTKIRFGYLDKFNKYSLNLTVRYDNIWYSCSSLGSFPARIELPFERTYKRSSSGIYDFTLVNLEPYTYRYSSYYTEEEPSKAFWEIWSPGVDLKSLEFPDELKDKLPDAATFIHGSTTFYHQGISYNDYLGIKFRGQEGPQNYVQYQVTVLE